MERHAATQLSGEMACVKCKAIKPLQDFPQGRKRRDGSPRYAYCKPCHSETQRVLRIKKFFNISIEEYDRVFEFQGGLCAICRQPPKSARLAVDHCHKTGLIRGLLCPWCNRAIALFRDNLERFENAVAYFKFPPFTQVLGEARHGLKGRVSNKAKTRDRLNKDLLERPQKNPRPVGRQKKKTNSPGAS